MTIVEPAWDDCYAQDAVAIAVPSDSDVGDGAVPSRLASGVLLR